MEQKNNLILGSLFDGSGGFPLGGLLAGIQPIWASDWRKSMSNTLDDYDYCYECGGYGDDYYINNDGELVSACDDCPHNSANWEDEDE